MIAVLVGAITALLLVLILARHFSPEFRRRAEAPKYRFLATLGVPSPSNNKERHT